MSLTMVNETGLGLTLRAALLLMAALLIVSLLRRASGQGRCIVWKVAFASLAALPLLAVALPTWSPRSLPAWLGQVFDPVLTEEGRLVGGHRTVGQLVDGNLHGHILPARNRRGRPAPSVAAIGP